MQKIATWLGGRVGVESGSGSGRTRCRGWAGLAEDGDRAQLLGDHGGGLDKSEQLILRRVGVR